MANEVVIEGSDPPADGSADRALPDQALRAGVRELARFVPREDSPEAIVELNYLAITEVWPIRLAQQALDVVAARRLERRDHGSADLPA
jgi:hypothetical protein